ncbi:MAG: polysaccharide deacetylase family protein [Actinomycetota bacterium]
MAVLTYHAVDPEWSAPLSVGPDQFRRHLDWIGDNRRVVALEETLTRRGHLAHHEVAITFDDGFTSVAKHALPALRDRGMRATIFLVGKMLDGSGGTIDWVDRPPGHPLAVLDPAVIRELHDEGVEFGSHSYAHRDLTTLGFAACVEDLRRGRDVLQEILGKEVTMLAYPFGRHDAHVRRAAAEAGFTWAFAMAMPPRAHASLAIPRVGIYPNDDLARLRMKTHSWYGRMRSSAIYPALHRIRARLRGGAAVDRRDGASGGPP